MVATGRIVTEISTQRPGYKVKNIEIVVEGQDVRVRLYTLMPGDVIPWHRTFTAQWPTGTNAWAGRCASRRARPAPTSTLPLAEACAIPPKTAPRIFNGGSGDDSRFLPLQGGGAYDFNSIGEGGKHG
jgi:hypothetical protein